MEDRACKKIVYEGAWRIKSTGKIVSPLPIGLPLVISQWNEYESRQTQHRMASLAPYEPHEDWWVNAVLKPRLKALILKEAVKINANAYSIGVENFEHEYTHYPIQFYRI